MSSGIGIFELLLMFGVGGLMLVALGAGVWGMVVWLEKRAERKSGNRKS
jgi:hypothetical protein